MNLYDALRGNEKALSSFIRILVAIETGKRVSTSDLCTVGMIAAQNSETDKEFVSILAKEKLS